MGIIKIKIQHEKKAMVAVFSFFPLSSFSYMTEVNIAVPKEARRHGKAITIYQGVATLIPWITVIIETIQIGIKPTTKMNSNFFKVTIFKIQRLYNRPRCGEATLLAVQPEGRWLINLLCI